MLIRKQNGFDEFVCIADRCPKSCCVGWQIVIDDKSLQKYRYVTGDFAPKLRAGIDNREKCFRQEQTRCAMLREDGLCELQKTMGEAYLCDTCRLYPRHEEEFLDLREETLTLSCPEVARMLLESSYTFGFTEEETEESDDPQEFEDCDPFLFDELAYAREKMRGLILNRKIPFQTRLSMIGAVAFDMQYSYDMGRIERIGEISDRLDEMDQYDLSKEPSVADIEMLNATGIGLEFSYALSSLSYLADLEVLEESWTDILQKAQAFFSDRGEASGEWEQILYPEQSPLQDGWEKLFLALLYTYFCGSVYDGQIYARCMIAIWSVRWIMMLDAASDLGTEQVIYLFAREIEHSDENINALISYFEDELPE